MGLFQAVLLGVPIASAMHPQPGAVHDEGDGFVLRTRLPDDPQALSPPRQRRKIRHRDVQVHQPYNLTGETLRLPERKPEHNPYRQTNLDRQIRIEHLTTPGLTARRGTALGHIIRHPDRQIPAPPKALVLLSRVRDALSRLREFVSARVVELVGHWAGSQSRKPRE